MKIMELRAENFMRLTVVQITPEGNLIHITGANGQGKTSTIDALWAALGGADAIPSEPIKAGKKAARIEVKLGDAEGLKLVVERTFTASGGGGLTIRSPDGGKFSKPQKMLDELMGAIGFDPLQFMRMTPVEQFTMLRHLVKMDEDIDALDRQRLTIYEARTAVGRQLASAQARATAIIVPEDLPDAAPDLAAITDRLTSAADHNRTVDDALRHRQNLADEAKTYRTEIATLEQRLVKMQEFLAGAEAAIAQDAKVVIPEPIDAAAVRAELDIANRIAEGFRRRQAKIEAEAEVTGFAREQQAKTDEIAAIDARKTVAITSAKMPVEGLALSVPEGKQFKDGTVTYQDHPLKQASGAEQLRVSAAIGAALNPKLRVLLCRDGSLLDSKSLKTLADFATERDMQIFLERVDESGEIGVVIEDGHVKGQEALVEAFLKEENAAGNDAPPKPASAVQDPARRQRAVAYAQAELAKLQGCATLSDADKADAEVRHMLRNFPEIYAESWQPAHKARTAELSKKK